jgi:hypothetical protein
MAEDPGELMAEGHPQVTRFFMRRKFSDGCSIPETPIRVSAILCPRGTFCGQNGSHLKRLRPAQNSPSSTVLTGYLYDNLGEILGRIRQCPNSPCVRNRVYRRRYKECGFFLLADALLQPSPRPEALPSRPCPRTCIGRGRGERSHGGRLVGPGSNTMGQTPPLYLRQPASF